MAMGATRALTTTLDLPMPKLKVALYNDVEVEVLSTSSCYG